MVVCYVIKLYYIVEVIDFVLLGKNLMLIGLVEIENEWVLNDLMKMD